MSKKYISVVAFLCVLAGGNIALGAKTHWEFQIQSDWITSERGAAADSNWYDQKNWYTKVNQDANHKASDYPLPDGYTLNPDNNHVDPNLVPCKNLDPNIWVCIEAKNPGPNVVTGPSFYGDASCSRLNIHPWTWVNYPPPAIEVNVYGGNFNCGAQIGLCSKSGTPPFTPHIVSNEAMNTDIAILSVYGGAMTAPGFWTIGADGNDYLDRDGLHIGGGDDGSEQAWGHVKMYGGSITVNRIKIYYGDVNLYGGLLYQNDANEPNFLKIDATRSMNKINIEGNETRAGELRLQGNRSSQVLTYAAQGRICPCWGKGTLFVNYDYNELTDPPEANYTSVTAFCTPGSAWDPTPKHLATRQELNQKLSWKPGPSVQNAGLGGRHAVYFGLDFDDVNTCVSGPGTTSADYNSDSNELTVHIVFSCEDNLEVECNSTDDINDFNTTTLHWTVDSIITKDGRTYLKLIRDAIGDVNEDVVIKYVDSNDNNDRGMCGHILLTAGDVVFQNACCTPTLRGADSVCSYKGRQDPCSYDPGLLTMDTSYYWRIDEYNNTSSDSPWKGNIWQFRTKGPTAGAPSPANSAVGLSIPLQLSWSAGALTQPTNGHAVFFSTDVNALNASDLNTLQPGVSRFIQTPTIFPLSSLTTDLVADTNYYWRVDEINTATPGSPWAGETWKFTNTNYFIIDNFESYDSNETMGVKWKTGYDYNSCTLIAPSGKIGWAFALPNENQGAGTMRYDYDDFSNPHNSYYFSEVRFDANGLDWTGGGALPDNDKARALAISYIGGPRNDADPCYDRMYVKIEDTAGHLGNTVNISNPEAQRTSSWQQWDVNLTDLNKPDVNLKSVKYLYLGFGKRCNATGTQGGKGTARFDDIRLYQKRCVPANAVGDLVGNDCRVDINDFNAFADNWLVKQTQLSTVQPPDANLMLWYKFDEITGKTVNDSKPSGTKYNGEVNSNEPANSWWTTGGYDGSGGCLNLKLSYRGIDYNTLVEANVAALGFLSDTNNAFTFSIWVNADTYYLEGWPRLICVFQDTNEATDENEVVEIECPVARPEGSTVRFRLGFLYDSNEVSKGSMQMSEFGGGWHHYAFVEDAGARLMRIYHNGELIAETNNTTAPMFGKPIESFRLGKRRFRLDEPWAGKIDDFKVYNYALSPAQIAWLGTKGTGNVPFHVLGDLRIEVPEMVNLGDYAILAQQWLKQQWWP